MTSSKNSWKYNKQPICHINWSEPVLTHHCIKATWQVQALVLQLAPLPVRTYSDPMLLLGPNHTLPWDRKKRVPVQPSHNSGKGIEITSSPRAVHQDPRNSLARFKSQRTTHRVIGTISVFLHGTYSQIFEVK